MSETLAFTGERYLPERAGEISYEHWHRYAFARGLGKHRAVLDVACGEGYGASLLSETADSVIGVDICCAAVVHAKNRYAHRPNLHFLAASCDRLPFAAASFDLAISFETIEHIATQQEFVAELARVLRPGGLLLLSSPNKRLYSDAPGYHNQYHVRELYRDQLEELLRAPFPHRAWFGQKLLFHSTIWPENRSVAASEYLLAAGAEVTAGTCPATEPMYYIVACSRDRALLPAALDRLSLFTDSSETIYRDYLEQTRRVLELDRLLLDRERLVAERDKLLALRTSQIDDAARLVAERDALLLARAEQLNERDLLLKSYSAQIAERDAALSSCAVQIAERDDLLRSYAAQIAERDAYLAARSAQLAERDKLLSSYAAQIAERDAYLLTRAEQIAERDALLNSYAAQIAERDVLLTLRTEQLEGQQRILGERAAQLAGRDETLAALQRELARRAGVVWWLKSPWRFMKRALRVLR